MVYASSSNMAKLGDILVGDLETVVDKDFGYKTTFAHSERRPDAPNPLLTIMDLGPISLPLSEVDANRMIAYASQASLSFRTVTDINKNPGNTWEIDPFLVSLENPAWQSFLQSNTANICSSLGLPDSYDIQYRLRKLLLYETGSRFHPHKDTQKEDDAFATMDIDLPSRFTGGEIILSRDSVAKVIDISSSCTTTDVLSWYTDVTHEVSSIRSGYRLVLSYDLIRRSLSKPGIVPASRNAGGLHRLHRILEQWRAGGYKWLPEHRMVALVLKHQYSESDLDMGQDGLKGQDAHKVNQIRWVADMLGFELLLTRFKLYRVFRARDDNHSEEIWCKGPRDMIEQYCTLEYFKNLKGKRIHGKIEHFNDGLITGGLDCMGDSDDEKIQSSLVEPSTVEHYYYRVALAIFRKEDMDYIMITACGVEYGLEKLRQFLTKDSLAPENRNIVDLLLNDVTMTRNNWKTMARISLRWHDLDLWNRTINRALQHLSQGLIALKEEMFHAWDTFGFQRVQSSYDAISGRRYDGNTVDFIHEVKARVVSPNEQEVVDGWCSKHITAFVKGVNVAFSVDIGNILLSIAKVDGIRLLKHFGGRISEYVQIAKLFMSEKERIYTSPPNNPARNEGEDLDRIFEDFVDKCVRGAIQYLDDGNYLPSTTTTAYASQNRQINNILEVVELCIITNRVDECTTVFRFIWDAECDPYHKLVKYYIPIILRLRTQLPELGTSLSSPPFATFVRNVIKNYMCLKLGSKTYNPRPSPQMPPCNESCSTCASLREFLGQLYVPYRDICTSKKTREHFVKVLSRLSAFVSITELTGGKYRVVKHRDFLDSNRWQHRLEQAREFLKYIGDDEFIDQVMGGQFEDLKLVLENHKHISSRSAQDRQ